MTGYPIGSWTPRHQRERNAQRANGLCPLPVASCRPLRASLAVLFALLLSTAAAQANGGTIQMASQPAGPYQLTVVTSPSPIRVGVVDVSVLVQKAGSDDLVQDATVLVAADPIGHEGRTGTFQATHELATNKLFYAANVDLPTEGYWRIGVRVMREGAEGSVSFQVEASPASLLDNPLLLVALLATPLLLASAWWILARRKTIRSHPSGS